jgi:transaldolase
MLEKGGVMENTILRNQAIGQSTWLDYIQRSMLIRGELGDLVKKGVTGLTSNPTIFERAITGSTDYDDALNELASASKKTEELFEALAVEDIQGAADVLRSVYDYTNGSDGFASLEVPPSLAHDTQATVREARRLFATLRRPNVMIKVPATPEGIPAVRTLIADGINVNVTLIFSIAAYESVIDAYIAGLEEFAAGGQNPGKVTSVASFFVSRLDTAIDAELRVRAANGEPALAELTGTAAVANARKAYAIFQRVFGGERFAALRAKGALPQRPLWASTSTKDPALPDTYYVDSLVGPDTVNTMPPATLEAVLDHGTSASALKGTEDAANQALSALAKAGINMDEITATLLRDGVASFAKSFDEVLGGIDKKREALAKADR